MQSYPDAFLAYLSKCMDDAPFQTTLIIAIPIFLLLILTGSVVLQPAVEALEALERSRENLQSDSPKPAVCPTCGHPDIANDKTQ